MHQGMFFSILSLLPVILTVADPRPPPSPPTAVHTPSTPSSPLENSTARIGTSPTTPSPIPSPTPTANANKWCIAPIGGFGCSLDCPAFTEKLRLEANFDKGWEKFVHNWRHNVSNQIATCQKVLTPNPDDTDKKVITMMNQFRHMFNCPNRNGMTTVLLEFLKGRNSAHDANDDCHEVIGVWRGISNDSKWRQEFDDWRHAYSNAYGKCEERLGQNETDRKTHAAIEVFREWLDCPLESGPNIMTIVAIVFIVAFLLAMAALVAVSLLYIRK